MTFTIIENDIAYFSFNCETCKTHIKNKCEDDDSYFILGNTNSKAYCSKCGKDYYDNKKRQNATITLRWSMDYDYFVMTYGKDFPKEKRERIWDEMVSNADHTDEKKDEHFWDMDLNDCPENRVGEIVDEAESNLDE